ncbi:hypothetical protein GCM10023212_37790 [Luteolibacter yonseiensis]
MILLLASTAGTVWLLREPLANAWGKTKGGVDLGFRRKFQPDPEKYGVLIKDLDRWRVDLAERHRKARNRAGREAVEHDARVILEQCLPEMMRCWLGTPWDFNGTAGEPGSGKIACGYFVATVLKDAGFRVDRYQLAQQPSENILRSFLPKESCALTIGKNYQAFAGDVAKLESGIYVIGLDTHVAFIVVRNGDFRFIHSSGSSPWCVVDEEPADAIVLQRSNWRMLGNLTGAPGVIRTWLKADKITVRGT